MRKTLRPSLSLSATSENSTSFLYSMMPSLQDNYSNLLELNSKYFDPVVFDDLIKKNTYAPIIVDDTQKSSEYLEFILRKYADNKDLSRESRVLAKRIELREKMNKSQKSENLLPSSAKNNTKESDNCSNTSLSQKDGNVNKTRTKILRDKSTQTEVEYLSTNAINKNRINKGTNIHKKI